MTELERKRAEARRLAEEAGARVLPFGAGWRVVGAGVDVLVADLASLSRADLESSTIAGWRKSRRAGAWTGRRPTTVGR